MLNVGEFLALLTGNYIDLWQRQSSQVAQATTLKKSRKLRPLILTTQYILLNIKTHLAKVTLGW